MKVEVLFCIVIPEVWEEHVSFLFASALGIEGFGPWPIGLAIGLTCMRVLALKKKKEIQSTDGGRYDRGDPTLGMQH